MCDGKRERENLMKGKTTLGRKSGKVCCAHSQQEEVLWKPEQKKLTYLPTQVNNIFQALSSLTCAKKYKFNSLPKAVSRMRAP